MAKTKLSGKDAAKASKDIQVKGISSVKEGAVTKISQTPKAKSKELAKEVATKADNKSKKAKKEPTPDTSSGSSASSDEESSASSSSSDEEPKVKTAKPGNLNGLKTNGAAKASLLSKGESSASSDSSEASESSESSESSGSDASSDEEDESRVLLSAPAAKAAEAAAKEESSSEEYSEQSDLDAETVPGAVDSKALQSELAKVASNEAYFPRQLQLSREASSASSSDESDSEEEKEAQVPAPRKRKAEAEESSTSAKKTSAEGDQSGNLFVGNLSWNVDEEWLKSEFEKFGELLSLRIVTDKDTGRSRGFGYVDFVNPEDAAKALQEMNGQQIDGRRLNVDTAAKRSEGAENSNKRQKTFGDSQSEPSETLFVANIAFDADEDMIGQAFGEHGTVTAVRLPKDIETDRPKGYGVLLSAVALFALILLQANPTATPLVEGVEASEEAEADEAEDSIVEGAEEVVVEEDSIVVDAVVDAEVAGALPIAAASVTSKARR
ncbi:MAG: hypothetical protein Q9191_007516 [Dirinaria sp. TL-2023a]